MWVFSTTRRKLYSGKEAGGWMGLGAGMDEQGKSHPIWSKNPICPDAMPITLSQPE